MGAAIAHMGYCNKMPQTGYLINNRNVLLTVLETGSLRLGCQHDRVRALFQVADVLYLHIMEGARKLCGVSFIKALRSLVFIVDQREPLNLLFNEMTPSTLGLREIILVEGKNA